MDDKIAVVIAIVIIVGLSIWQLDGEGIDKIPGIVTNAVSALAGLATGVALTKGGKDV